MAGATSSRHSHLHPHARVDGRGVALCVAAAVGFGCMAIFAKDAYKQHLSITSLLTLRFTLAALIFWAIARARNASALPPRRTLLAALGLGAVGYAAQSGFFFVAVKRMDASTTSLLLYTYPAMVFIAALLLRREPADRRRLAALTLACAGTALVLLGGGSGSFDTLGVFMAVGAAVAYTTYILVADTVVGKLDPFLLSAIVTTGAAGTFWIAAIAQGGIDATLSTHGWLDIAGIVLVSTILPISTFLLGLERVGPSTASIVSCFEPVVTVSLAMALFGERLGAGQLAGGVFVLGAVVLLQLRRSSSLRPDAAPAPAAGPAPARALAREPS
jgi:drug/metabolite transporter (DMT)-like permease